jgi:type VI secretion system secreted protein VgrG
VTVQFVEGDIDRPVIVGGLYGGGDAMPFSAGVDSGVNHPGVIAGLHSQRLDGAGFNQFALDDAPGQLRTRLHASHASSELGLGHLMQHSDGDAQRGGWRGTGFEAGTAGWASVRGAQGLFVSTSARAGTYGSAQATRMDASEGVAQLKAARDLGQRLGQAATAVNAQGLATHDDGQAVARFVQAVDPTQDGKHPDTVNGQPAMQPDPDGRSAGSDPVHAFARPVMLFDTPAATLAASAASLSTFAGQALSVVAQSDLQQTAAHTSTQASGATSSLYAHQNGILAMAANGPVSLRAHTDALSILADQSVTITSVNDEIRIGANQQIQLVAGQSAITLKGGDIDFTTPGAFTVHGATHAFEAAATGQSVLSALPAGLVGEPTNWIAISHVNADGAPLAGQKYKIHFEGGTVISGALDAAGKARHDVVPKIAQYVEYEPREPGKDADWPPLERDRRRRQAETGLNR